MKKISILWGIALIAFLLSGTSCKKYQYGPYLSLSTKKQRIEGEWKVDSAITRFGVDIGPDLATYRFAFDADGEAGIGYFQTGTGTQSTLYGEWGLEEEKDLFTWKDLAGDTLGFYYTRNETFDILRLTAQEFWLADKDNTFLYLSQ